MRTFDKHLILYLFLNVAKTSVSIYKIKKSAPMTSSRWKRTFRILSISGKYLNIWITLICNVWHWRTSDCDVWHINCPLTNRLTTIRSAQLALLVLPWEYPPSIPPFTLMQEVSKLEGNWFNSRPIRCLPLPELYLCRCYLWRSTWERSSRQQKDYWVWKSSIWGNRPT